MTNERRLKRIELYEPNMANLFKPGNTITEGLPRDAEFVRMIEHADGYSFVFRSEQFEPVEEGELIPQMDDVTIRVNESFPAADDMIRPEELLKHDRNVIAVDFDNTITTGDETYFTGGEETPDRDMLDWLERKYRENNVIIIHTARPESVRAETKHLLEKWGVRYHALEMEKLSADIYVDDKAFRPEEVVHR